MRYQLIVSYDGSSFHGFQRQKNLISVQSEIEKALGKVFFHNIIIASAGRTDAKVHAVGQVIHFDSDIEIPTNNLREVLNKHLEPHIYVKKVSYVDSNFHARVSAVAKEYHYRVSLGEFDPLKSRYVSFWPADINLDAIREAMKYFMGEHDFKTFTKNKKITNTVRTITKFSLEQTSDLLTFVIIGDGFMHNMVRIIMGILKRIGEGKMDPQMVPELLLAKNRKKAPYIEEAAGLYLYKVYY